MQPIRISLIQTKWPGSREQMMTQLRELIAQAAKSGAQLIGLPEFSLLPYFPGRRDKAGFAWAETLPGGSSEQFFSEMTKTHHVQIIGSLYEKADDGRYYDTATLHNSDGTLIGVTRKVHIPSGEGYHETDFFEGWHEYPVHSLGSVNVAAPTCYDQWFPEVARIYAMNGADMIFYPTAIGGEPNAPEFDSQQAWQLVMRGHAIANGVFIGAANRVGEENGIPFYGSSFICDPMGNVLAQASRDQVEVITADLDPVVMRQWRELFPLMHQRRPHTYQRLLEKDVQHQPPAWLEE